MRGFSLLDLSGGVQQATNHLIRKRQEVADSKNSAFNIKIGSATRRDGYEQVGQVVQYGNDSLYGGVYLYGVNNKILTGVNNASNTNATLRFLDSTGYWTDIINTASPNTRFQCVNYLDELYVAGRSDSAYMTLTNVDYTLQPSTTRNVLNAPACRFIAEFQGRLYAINCQIGNNIYRDRMYQSSGGLGAVTFIQGAQSGLITQLHVDSVRYLKVGMTVDIYAGGTENLQVQGLQIVSVDKKNNRIGFIALGISLQDRDEVWLSGRKGRLTTFWNTDYPTPEASDWLRIPAGPAENAEFSGFHVNNNRLLLFSQNSIWKWDGNNLIKISPSVGCVSHETIKSVSSWTIWLHTSGVWGYNDNTGQLKLLSRAVNPLLKRMNPSNYKYASAVFSTLQGRVYKLSLGQLLDPTLATTSTSTSSTSTSSTSSSTSSTSTSSTSASSVTTTTITITTTSTSSTSTSTTTSTVTTTTTLPTGKATVRLCYDFDLNIWWYEEHNREQRFQFQASMNGFTKPYFTDENGYLFRDETGLTDNGLSIPMFIETGRTNCGTEQAKTWDSVQWDSEKARGAVIQYQLDAQEWRTLGQIKDNIETMNFPQRGSLIRSRDINFRYSHNDYGEAPVFNGGTLYFNSSESLVNELGERK